MESGLVSVVIPVYNGARWLRQAIDSVLAQTYRPVEIVAVDDGSTDSSPEILASYGSAVRVHRQANTGSVGLARNAGMERGRGEFIALLDQDDWWRPEKLQRQVEVMGSDPRIGLVHTAVQHVDDATGQPCAGLDPNHVPERMVGDCYEALLLQNPIYNSSVLIRRAAVDEVGMCDPRIPGNTVQDYDLWLRIAARYRLGYVPEALTYYRLHAAQGLRDRRAMLQAELGVLLRVRPEAAWRSGPAAGRRRLAAVHGALAVAHLDQGDFRSARKSFREAWRWESTLRRAVRCAASHLPAACIETLRSAKRRARGAADSSSGG